MIPSRMSVPIDGWGSSHLSPDQKGLLFDRILCDVPCSGDGTLRKSPDLWRRWGDGLSLGVHRAQLGILVRGLQALSSPLSSPRTASHSAPPSLALLSDPSPALLHPRPTPPLPPPQLLVPGGRLVYSTCSMNPVEDEAVIAHALLKLREEGASGVRLVSMDDELPLLKRAAGVNHWRVRCRGVWYDDYASVPEKLKYEKKILPSMFPPPAADLATLDLHRCMRVLPHYQDTGGFFIAVLEKAPLSHPEAEAAHGLATELVTRVTAGALSAAYGVGELSGPEPPLRSVIKSQEGAKAGAHVMRALHCAPTNNGAYDALYSLTPEWTSSMRSFFGLDPSFDSHQIVSRSITGKCSRTRRQR